MDSNYGEHHNDYTRCNALFKTGGLKNVLNDNEPHNMCFKMRHTKGRQSKKFCELIFETIDRFFVHNSTTAYDIGKTVATKSFERFTLDAKTIAELTETRRSAAKMGAVNTMCKAENWYNTDTFQYGQSVREKSVMFGNRPVANNTGPSLIKKAMYHIYPNAKAPSDHPPVAIRVCL